MAGLLESITRGIGRAIAEVGGVRSTRTTAVAAPETRLLSGALSSATVVGTTVTFAPSVTNTTPPIPSDGSCLFRVLADVSPPTLQTGSASGTEDGTRIRISAGTFAADVLPGRVFTVTSGPQSGKNARINRRVSDTELVLDGLGVEGDFSTSTFTVTFSHVGRTAPIVGVAGPTPITGLTLAYELGPNITGTAWEIVQRSDTTVDVESTLDWPTAGEIVVGSARLRYSSKTLTTIDAVRPRRYSPAYGHIVVVAGASLVDGETVTIDDGQGQVTTFEFDTSPFLVAPGNIPVRFTAAMTANQVRDALIERITRVMPTIAAFPGPGTGHLELRPYDVGGIGAFDVVDTVAAVGFLTPGPRGLEASVRAGIEVVDFSQTWSAVDQNRNALIVDRATGEDLAIIGKTIGAPRPLGLVNDTIYRDLIKATAYAPRGTVFAIESALNAVLGIGNWELFEDLTLGSFNFGATVFLRRNDGIELDSTGRTFLGPLETRPLTSPTAVALANPPIDVGGVLLAPEGPSQLIAESSPSTLAAVLVGFNQTAVVTTPVVAFSTAVMPGDLFVTKRTTAVIRTRVSGTQLTLGPLRGAPSLPATALEQDVPWQILRPKSDYRFYTPDNEVYLERSGGAATPAWVATGAGTGTSALATGLTITTTLGQTKVYTRALRIDPTSRARFSLTLDLDQFTNIESAGLGHFWAQIEDGARLVAITVVKDNLTSTRYVRFTDGTSLLSADIGNGSAGTGIRHIEVVREHPEWVDVLVDGVRVLSKRYSTLPASSNRRLVFGNQSTTVYSTARVYDLAFHVTGGRDFMSARATTLSTMTSEFVTDSGPGIFDVGDALNQKRFYILDYGARNTSGGSAKGEWQIDQVLSATSVHVTGPTRSRGFLTDGEPTRFSVRDLPNAFTWPDVRGHRLQIMSGPNAGIYPVRAILDPATFTDVEEPRLGTHSSNPKLVVFVKSTESSAALGGDGPRVRIHGLVVGARATYTLDVIEAGVIVTTSFDANSIDAVELYDVAGNTQPTFTGDVEVYAVPSYVTSATEAYSVGTKLFVLKAGQRTVGGRRRTVARSSSWTSDSLVDVRFPSNVVELDTAGAVPPRPDGLVYSAAEMTWRLVPDFPNTTIVGEVADAATLSGATVTLRTAMPFTPSGDYPVVNVRKVDVRSAHLIDLQDVNTETSPGVFTQYPAYLFDAFGFLREIIDALTAAGVRVDYDHLFRDATGLRIVGLREQP